MTERINAPSRALRSGSEILDDRANGLFAAKLEAGYGTGMPRRFDESGDISNVGRWYDVLLQQEMDDIVDSGDQIHRLLTMVGIVDK
ncbi:MAG: hypothetical protein KDA58_02135 [Planctomycetaceae bacterium]|nr:hypothetical protein [Planctomycetaceae bacterium]